MNEQDLISTSNTNDAAYCEIDLEMAYAVEDGSVDCLCMHFWGNPFSP
jgi:hypothetical protein